MQIISVLRTMVVWWMICQETRSFTITRNKEYRGSGEVANKNGINSEPSCEELKAMWRFSKRQSRAAEITNEIPTYRDPFSYNVWEPYYARSRSIGGGRPVYGRVVHKAPVLRIQDIAERNRAFEEVARMYGNVGRPIEPRRRVAAFRLSGGGHLPSMGLTPQSGSFQHLKELIRTERARELQEQRLAEEAAARSEALKELTSGSHRQGNSRDMSAYSYETLGGREEQDIGPTHKLLAFPDLLAPPSRYIPEEARYNDDYSYFRPRNHRSFLEISSFNNDLEGLVL